MATSYGNEVVKAPGEMTLTSYVTVPDELGKDTYICNR